MVDNKICFSKGKLKTLVLGGVLVITAFFLTRYVNNNLRSSSAGSIERNIDPSKNQTELQDPIIYWTTTDTNIVKSLKKKFTSDEIKPGIINRPPSEDYSTLVQDIAIRDLEYYQNYTYLIFSVAIEPAKLEILHPLVTPIYLRGRIIALAVPKSIMMTGASTFTAISLALNPGVVQDVSEGTPRLIYQGQVHQLSIQEVTYLRVEGYMNFFSVTAGVDGQEIARLSGDSSQNVRCQVEGCPTPQISAPPNQQSQSQGLDTEQLRREINGTEENNPLAQWFRDNSGGQTPRSVTITRYIDPNNPNSGIVEFELPYYDLRPIFNQPSFAGKIPEKLSGLITAARNSHYEVRLHVGPGMTIDPILDINPSSPTNSRVLVIAIDAELQAATAGVLPTNRVINLHEAFATRTSLPTTVTNLTPQTPESVVSTRGNNPAPMLPASQNAAFYIKANIFDIINYNIMNPGSFEFPYIRVHAPYSPFRANTDRMLEATDMTRIIDYENMNVDQPEYLGYLASLLARGGRFDVSMHQFDSLAASSRLSNIEDLGLLVEGNITNLSYGPYGYGQYGQSNNPSHILVSSTYLQYSEYTSLYGNSTSIFLNKVDEPITIFSIFRLP